MYKFTPGNRVLLRGKPYIVSERYYPNGCFSKNPIAYTIYPPGKRGTPMYHVWALQDDLTKRK
jgi:hypothetical protein